MASPSRTVTEVFTPLTQEFLDDNGDYVPLYSSSSPAYCPCPSPSYSPTVMECSPANFGNTLGLGKTAWNLLSPPRLVRQDAFILPASPIATPVPYLDAVLPPPFVPSPLSPRERAMARVPRTEQRVMQLPSLDTEDVPSLLAASVMGPTSPIQVATNLSDLQSQMMPPPVPRKVKRSRPVIPHQNVTVRAARRVRLSSSHLHEVRLRFNEVMDVLDPECPTCHRRLSDCQMSCDQS